jgi:hypothetical protein
MANKYEKVLISNQRNIKLQCHAEFSPFKLTINLLNVGVGVEKKAAFLRHY